jgi:hypothetical protein
MNLPFLPQIWIDLKAMDQKWVTSGVESRSVTWSYFIYLSEDILCSYHSTESDVAILLIFFFGCTYY